MADVHEQARHAARDDCQEAGRRLTELAALLHGLYDLGRIDELIDDLRQRTAPGVGAEVHRAALAVLGKTYQPPTTPPPADVITWPDGTPYDPGRPHWSWLPGPDKVRPSPE